MPDVDPKKIELDLQPGSLTFTGFSDSKKATYHLKMDFYAEIDPKESKINHTPRDVELVLQKKDLQEEYWPRLLKEKAKVHYLKTNFDKVSRYDILVLGRPLTCHYSGSTRTSKTSWQRTTTT